MLERPKHSLQAFCVQLDLVFSPLLPVGGGIGTARICAGCLSAADTAAGPLLQALPILTNHFGVHQDQMIQFSILENQFAQVEN
jgi:hypothetical protein